MQHGKSWYINQHSSPGQPGQSPSSSHSPSHGLYRRQRRGLAPRRRRTCRSRLAIESVWRSSHVAIIPCSLERIVQRLTNMKFPVPGIVICVQSATSAETNWSWTVQIGIMFKWMNSPRHLCLKNRFSSEAKMCFDQTQWDLLRHLCVCDGWNVFAYWTNNQFLYHPQKKVFFSPRTG